MGNKVNFLDFLNIFFGFFNKYLVIRLIIILISCLIMSQTAKLHFITYSTYIEPNRIV